MPDFHSILSDSKQLIIDGLVVILSFFGVRKLLRFEVSVIARLAINIAMVLMTIARWASQHKTELSQYLENAKSELSKFNLGIGGKRWG